MHILIKNLILCIFDLKMGDGRKQRAAGCDRQGEQPGNQTGTTRLGQETGAGAPPLQKKKGRRQVKIRSETEILSKGAVCATHHH